jgi:hypothetical protein
MQQYLTLDEQIVALCATLCGQYPFMSENYRTAMVAAITAMRPLCDGEQQGQIDNLLAGAIEDTRLGYSDAEIDDYIRDANLARTAAAAQQNAEQADGDL